MTKRTREGDTGLLGRTQTPERGCLFTVSMLSHQKCLFYSFTVVFRLKTPFISCLMTNLINLFDEISNELTNCEIRITVIAIIINKKLIGLFLCRYLHSLPLTCMNMKLYTVIFSIWLLVCIFLNSPTFILLCTSKS